MNVLLVDDSPTHQFQLTRIIESEGHSVTVANSGEAAVQLMEHAPADLIISDIEMPGLNGFETVSIVREALGQYWVPIIFTTSRNELTNFVQGFAAGADDYLIKPVKKEILCAKIRVMERFISMQQQVQALQQASSFSSRYDESTHVYNAQYFFEMALQQWAVCSRQRQPVSVLIVGIDEYSKFNAFYGEEAGNACLHQVAAKIAENILRPADIVGRFQQEGFILLLPDTGRAGASHVAEKIRFAIESLAIEHKTSTVCGSVSVSIGGGTCFRPREQTLHRCIELACEMLLGVEEGRGNSVMVGKLENMSCHNVGKEKSWRPGAMRRFD